MSGQVTPESSHEAMEGIYADTAKGLDEAGATEKSAYMVVANVQLCESPMAALRAAEMNLKLRGKLVDRSEVKVSGSVSVMAEVVDALAKLKAEGEAQSKGKSKSKSASK